MIAQMFTKEGDPLTQDQPPENRARKDAKNKPSAKNVISLNAGKPKPRKDCKKRKNGHRIGKREKKSRKEVA